MKLVQEVHALQTGPELEEGMRYTYRKHSDGTIDAICMTCFLTALKANNAVELLTIADDHVCYGSVSLPFAVTQTKNDSKQHADR